MKIINIIINYCLADHVHVWHVFLARAPPSACVRLFTYVHVCLLKSHNTSASVFIRPRTCMYDCVCAHMCASVRVRVSALVCIHIIKSLDTSAHIKIDASGRVFHSRTFEMHYIYSNSEVITLKLLQYNNTL